MTGNHVEVLHSWQEDPELLALHLMEPRQRCGLACLEMVIRYHASHVIRARDIYERAIKYGAINANNDWWHPGQVRVLESYGLVAWRRNWRPQPQNPDYFAEHENYTAVQMAAVRAQLAGEAGKDREAQFTYSVHRALEAGQPVIVSVKAGFSDNSHNHQVVVSGYEPEFDSFEVHDPVKRLGPNSETSDRLLQHANLWAIFAHRP